MSGNRYFSLLAKLAENHPMPIVTFALNTLPKGGVAVVLVDGGGRTGTATGVSPEHVVDLAFQRLRSSKMPKREHD